MKTCYVCATPMTPQAPSCKRCNTDAGVLQELEYVAKRHRFLFGSIRQPPREEEPKDEAIPVTAKKTQAPKPAPKRRRPASTVDLADAAMVHPLPGDTQSLDIPLIREPDPGAGVTLPPAPDSAPFYLRGSAHLVDVACCILLNLFVFQVILWFTNGSLSTLVTFSLIPILFVQLGFTIMYFWLFIGLFQKSLGHILVALMTDRHQS